MTTATILAAATRVGVNLSVRAGTVYAAPPGRLPAELVDEIKAHKEELVAALALPACTACRAPVASPEDILCGACHAERRGAGRVLAFDPGRRLRTLARLSGRACEMCGATDWHVTARGDAACRGCFTSSRGGADACTPVQIASGSTPSTPGTRTSGVRGDAA